MEPHTFVTAGQLQDLAAALREEVRSMQVAWCAWQAGESSRQRSRAWALPQHHAAPLAVQGREPSFGNMTERLRCTLPWSNSSDPSSSSTDVAVLTEAGRMAAGRRTRRAWSHEEERALMLAAATRALDVLTCAQRAGSCLHALSRLWLATCLLPALYLSQSVLAPHSCRSKRRARIAWEAVAHEVGSGRSGAQCKEKWKQLLQRPPEAASEEQGEEAEERQRQRQPTRDYWSEEEEDAAAALLGTVGAKLATDISFALAARSFPAKLAAAVRLWGGLPLCHCAVVVLLCSALAPATRLLQCHTLWGMRLEERLPGRSKEQVKVKCRGMLQCALKVRGGAPKFRGHRRLSTAAPARALASTCLLPAPQMPCSWLSTSPGPAVA